MQFIARIHADHAEVLDRRFRAVAGATGGSDLELVGHPRSPGHPLYLDAEAGRILRAEAAPFGPDAGLHRARSEEHTSELQSLMRISYAVFCLKKKNNTS